MPKDEDLDAKNDAGNDRLREDFSAMFRDK
jgi:hypothetical protein